MGRIVLQIINNKHSDIYDLCLSKISNLINSGSIFLL